jgi:hypothetical protein
LFVTEGASCIEQHNTSAVLTKGRTRCEGCKPPKGISGDHRWSPNPFVHIGHELITPKGTAVLKAGGLGTATKAQQIDGVDRMALGQDGDVVSPMVRGGSKAMDQQKSRTIGGDRLIRFLRDRMDGMAEMAPGTDLHNNRQVARC